MNTPTLALTALCLALTTPSLAGTTQDALTLHKALTAFQAAYPDLETTQGGPCELTVRAAFGTQSESFKVHTTLGSPGQAEGVFSISGPRISGVYEAFQIESSDEVLTATVTLSDSDGYGLWDTFRHELRIEAGLIQIETTDLQKDTSETVVCLSKDGAPQY